MQKLVLTRSTDDRHRYDLDGYGTIRKPGILGSRHELSTLDGTVFTTDVSSFFSYTVRMYDADGEQVGTYNPNFFKGGGDVGWDGKVFQLRYVHEEKTLVLGRLGKDLLRIRSHRWRPEAPVELSIDDPAADPALVLFVARLILSVRSDRPSGGGG